MATWTQPAWDDAADAWLRRSLDRYLQMAELPRDTTYLGDQDREDLRQSAEIRATVVEQLVARRLAIVLWCDAPRHYPSEDNGWWEIDQGAVDARVWEALRDARLVLRAPADALRWPTLEAWLGSLSKGELASEWAPEEMHAIAYLNPAIEPDGFLKAAKARRRRIRTARRSA